MTLKEFAESRGIEYNTLMQWLFRRPELREKMPKEGKNYVVAPGDGVYEVLDKKYPFPRPVQIVQDEEARQELAEARKKLLELQEAMIAITAKAAQAEAMQMMIEQKDAELEQTKQRAEEAEQEGREAENRARAAEAEADRLRAAVAVAETAAAEAKEQVEKMENAGLFARIFKSWR